uniref:Uncharacterized protein n=1 Tax=Setaria italica TaxID=4555 RepID=K4ANX7_SETIT
MYVWLNAGHTLMVRTCTYCPLQAADGCQNPFHLIGFLNFTEPDFAIVTL